MLFAQAIESNDNYIIIQDMIPKGFYLEIFGRRNNLRPRWVTIGNEI